MYVFDVAFYAQILPRARRLDEPTVLATLEYPLRIAQLVSTTLLRWDNQCITDWLGPSWLWYPITAG
jgi:hypothetical protein